MKKSKRVLHLILLLFFIVIIVSELHHILFLVKDVLNSTTQYSTVYLRIVYNITIVVFSALLFYAALKLKKWLFSAAITFVIYGGISLLLWTILIKDVYLKAVLYSTWITLPLSLFEYLCIVLLVYFLRFELK